MRPESERSDWTDTDLLTNHEARERLEEAVAELTVEIEQRRGDATAGPLEELENRLARFQESLDELRSR